VPGQSNVPRKTRSITPPIVAGSFDIRWPGWIADALLQQMRPLPLR
jgi:hypothetical protein